MSSKLISLHNPLCIHTSTNEVNPVDYPNGTSIKTASLELSGFGQMAISLWLPNKISNRRPLFLFTKQSSFNSFGNRFFDAHIKLQIIYYYMMWKYGFIFCLVLMKLKSFSTFTSYVVCIITYFDLKLLELSLCVYVCA